MRRQALGWRIVPGAVGRYREVLLAAAFVGMASYELLEMWMLELPRGGGLSLTLLVHSVQVALILGATYAFIRAWQDKTAHEDTLARMVERVVFAQEAERRRIAYDVHDGIAQLIVSAKQHLDTCGDVWPTDPSRAGTELAKGVDRLQRAIAETRRILMALRPSAVDAVGLVEAMRNALDEIAAEAGWSVTFTDDLRDARLTSAVETAVFRIFQEALANALRHAGTSRVDVELRRTGESLTLAVADTGVGFQASDDSLPRRGLGLVSMAERAKLLGGTCTIASERTRGTRVLLRLPLAQFSPADVTGNGRDVSGNGADVTGNGADLNGNGREVNGNGRKAGGDAPRASGRGPQVNG
jgi:signal transduction histidine kinase